VSLIARIQRVVAGRRDLVRRFEGAVRVESGRRAGDPETAIAIDHLLPDPAKLGAGRARWRLATARTRLARFPVGTDALAEWHRADARKGRRLIASDLRNKNRAGAILSWHYEPRRGRNQRPHLITSLAVRHDVGPDLRAEYMVALWLLTCVALAIDRRTIRRGRVGVVLDNAIELDAAELAAFGLTRGVRKEKWGLRTCTPTPLLVAVGSGPRMEGAVQHGSTTQLSDNPHDAADAVAEASDMSCADYSLAGMGGLWKEAYTARSTGLRGTGGGFGRSHGGSRRLGGLARSSCFSWLWDPSAIVDPSRLTRPIRKLLS
jgi:hypothetical protein